MKQRSNRIFYIGNRYLIAYLTFLSAFAPLSTDMYLPALPVMASALHTSDELVSYSMTLFFFAYAFAALIWGPLSDRYGRKPVLIAGSIIYIISCAWIALTDSIIALLAMRVAQAIGCAAVSAISLAVVKDVLRGQLMERLISFMQAAHVLAPILAPLIGGAMLYFVGWRDIFWAQVLFGVISIAGAFCLRETGRLKQGLSLLAAFLRMGAVLANRKFLAPLLLFSGLVMPFMSFLAVSTFVYQVQFGLSAQAFSLFFAFNASFSLLGPLAHLFIAKHMGKTREITWQILIIFACGVLLIPFGGLNPWLFALLMAPITFCGSAMRPPSTVILMEANRGDNGAVASLIQGFTLLFASLAMFLAPLPFWKQPVTAIAWIAAIVSGLALLAWLGIGRSY